MPQVNPYLNFPGNCADAFEFYHSVLGGEMFMDRFENMPQGEGSPEVDPDLVMHVSLVLGDGQVLMGSDRPEQMGPVVFGNNAHVSLAPDTAEDTKRVFDALADGGTVVMPLQRTFWGADFGMLVDRFGVQWMLNYELTEAQAQQH